MGDMNCRWKHMIEQDAAVNPLTHAHATRPSYLPGMAEPVLDRYTGKPRATEPASFDLIVVTRPLVVELAPKQLGPKFTPCKLPRTLMKSLSWPSDHTSVVATVKGALGPALTLATWNVADCAYFGQFWPQAAYGFDWQPESERLHQIEAHALKLLDASDVVGLQEVPSALVERLVEHGAARQFQVQWVAAPSRPKGELQSDGVKHVIECPWYKRAAGRHGCSTSAGGIAAALPLPPTAHDMLFARFAALPTSTGQAIELEVGADVASSAAPIAPSASAAGKVDGTSARAGDDVPEDWEDL
uniref:Endonuclease/exonuclease/phosphatase domain-containing protein n=1 Tax=Calcidiscus leptoporus TaxID=127549 RepID=A0A7S0NWL6_9EUKA|mmetsp:Transcript_35492/g.82890  ORF Transcript_35492/g.82890 Transcript_35492/m.82890 type:complete len:301 (+) Transcript_35492:223-1125(+)